MRSAKRKEPISAISINFRRIRSICDPCSKQYMRLARINFGSKWKRFAWQIPEAQGSDCQAISLATRAAAMKASAFLQMFVVVIDREPELA
jgi:hypothetical protein